MVTTTIEATTAPDTTVYLVPSHLAKRFGEQLHKAYQERQSIAKLCSSSKMFKCKRVH